MKPLRPVAKKVATTGCQKCDEKSGVDPWCIPCCVRWFSGMPDAAWMAYNAPLLLFATSEAHLNLVREAFKAAQTAVPTRRNK